MIEAKEASLEVCKCAHQKSAHFCQNGGRMVRKTCRWCNCQKYEEWLLVYKDYKKKTKAFHVPSKNMTWEVPLEKQDYLP